MVMMMMVVVERSTPFFYSSLGLHNSPGYKIFCLCSKSLRARARPGMKCIFDIPHLARGPLYTVRRTMGPSTRPNCIHSLVPSLICIYKGCKWAWKRDYTIFGATYVWLLCMPVSQDYASSRKIDRPGIVS